MSDVRFRRTTVVLAVALAATLLVVAVLVGILLGKASTGSRDDEDSTEPLVSTTSAGQAGAEVASDPTPKAQLADGSELPGLIAVIVACDKSGTSYDGAFFSPGNAEVNPDFHPETLQFDSATADDIALFGISQPLAKLDCALEVLGAPPGVIERMGQTRAIDGTLSEGWPGYDVTWTYHPDAGLVAVFSYDIR